MHSVTIGRRRCRDQGGKRTGTDVRLEGQRGASRSGSRSLSRAGVRGGEWVAKIFRLRAEIIQRKARERERDKGKKNRIKERGTEWTDGWPGARTGGLCVELGMDSFVVSQ